MLPKVFAPSSPRPSPLCRATVGPLLAAPLLAAPACGEGAPESGTEPVVRDSAGVTVVEAPVPPEGPADGWWILPDPAVEIGKVEGEEPYLFSHVESAGRLPDGRIFATDLGTSQVRVFGEGGRFLGMLGGPGEGPGEFRTPASSVHPYRGDSLAVVEFLGRRISVFDRELRFGRAVVPGYDFLLSQDAQPAHSCCRVLAPLGDGGWLVQYPEEGPLDGAGLRRGRVRLVRLSAEGEVTGEIGVFGGGLWTDSHPAAASPLMQVPFTGRLTAAIRPDGQRILVGNGADPRVEERDPAGRLLRLVRLSLEPPPFGGEARRAYEEGRQGVAEEFAEQQGRDPRIFLADLDHLPDRLPAFDRIFVDPEDRIWLLPPTVPDAPPVPGEALVLAPDGAVLGRVELPAGVRPVQVGRHEIVGVTVDELGVPRVVVHPIERGGR